MCGICGSLSLERNAVDPAGVRAMMAAMVHRGPDAEGLFTRPGIAAGIRRLAVIDVEGGDQPIAGEDGSVQVVCNGEIYNYRELREELQQRGHTFRTRSDTEVLVHLWEDDGPRMVQRLNGMFAFCLHDSGRGETFIARDRIGIKPLFYRLHGDRLVFASEIAALLRHDDVPAEVDGAALVELFCLQFLAGDATVYRGIRKLLPGHAIHVKDGAATISRYYELPRPATPVAGSLAERAAELRELVRSSVSYRLISDVPLGMFLSGGLDSSVLLSVLSDLVDRPVRTYSVGFEGGEALDEREFAALAARAFGAEHHELIVSPTQIAELLPRLVAHLGEPVLDPAMIPTYLLSDFARREVTVVLSGEGADELFGGYRRYLYQNRYGWLSRVPGVRQMGRGALAGRLPRRVEQALDALGQDDPASSHLEWASTLGTGLASKLFDAPLFEAYRRRVVETYAPYFPEPQSRLAHQLRADQGEWLPHNLLAKIDRATMAFSLEARVPFLDHRIVEWAAGLPDELKIRGGTTKRILREAFREQIPRRILERPKRGFDLPLATWIRGPLRAGITELLASDALERWEGLDAGQVREMLQLHLSEKQDFGLPLFNLYSILLFLQQGHR